MGEIDIDEIVAKIEAERAASKLPESTDLGLDYKQKSRTSRKSLNLTGVTVVNEEYQKLLRAWISERCSPELQVYLKTTVEKFNEQIQEIHNVLIEESTSSDAGTLVVDNNELDDDYNSDYSNHAKFRNQVFCRMIRQTDLERMKYTLRSYLRARIEKINQQASHYLELSTSTPKLFAPHELDYLKRYIEAKKSLFADLVLDKLPEKYNRANDPEMIDHPKLGSFVIFQVPQPIAEPVSLNAQDELVLEKDGIYIIKYNIVQHLIKSNQVELL